MSENIEFKAFFAGDVEEVATRLNKAGYVRASFRQKDTFIKAESGYLKVRENDGQIIAVIAYDRTHSPVARESSFEYMPVDAKSTRALIAVVSAVTPLSVVVKDRIRLERNGVIVNLDVIEGLGTFVECEVEIVGRTEAAAHLEAVGIRKLLGLEPRHIVGPAYAELLATKKRAAKVQAQLDANDRRGRLILLDGASATGKTTACAYLKERYGTKLKYARRATTRKRRENERGFELEYIGMTPATFNRRIMKGDFLEYRDFEFGMSYGLPFSEIVSAFDEPSSDVLGLMNLGNARTVDLMWPSAATTLILTDPDIVKRRLLRRGGLTAEQIAERVGNATLAHEFAADYKFVLHNNDDDLNSFSKQLDRLVKDIAEWRP